MTIGRLNVLIDVLRAKKVRDAAGEEVQEFAKHHRKVPAAYAETSGGKSPRGLQVEATVTSVFTIRYLRDVSDQDRIGYDGREYTIIRIVDVDGNKQWAEIHCSDVR
ncbi:MAG: phage head closure protein [Pirellulales bacterium]|nr:phage head closure protein [Pirellulales bacterium]